MYKHKELVNKYKFKNWRHNYYKKNHGSLLKESCQNDKYIY
jgi:hypothetical protein